MAEVSAGRRIEPEMPTKARPGTIEKVKVMAARFANGLPLWNNLDSEEGDSETGSDWQKREVFPTSEVVPLAIDDKSKT